MAVVDDSRRFGKALIAMLEDQGRAAVPGPIVSSERAFGRNETIYSAGQPGKEMFVVTRGRVQLYYENNLGEKVVVRELGAGEQFGEIALVDGEPQPFTAVAMDDVELLVLDRADLEELISRYPHLAVGLLTENCGWLRRLAGQLRDQSAQALEYDGDEARPITAAVMDGLARLIGNPIALAALGFAILGWLYFGQFGHQGFGAFPPFDPYPFPSLQLALIILAAVQAPIVLMTLNRLADRQRRRSDLDAEADARLEIELNRLQARMDRQHDEVRKQLAKAEAARGTDPALARRN
jgi:CRP-like cAMP-binding protein